MDSVDLQALSCPDCGNGFDFAPSRQLNTSENSRAYGILRCRCFEYPVVDSVAIITKKQVGILAGHGFRAGELESNGTDVAEIVRLVATGHGLEALIRCLAFTPRLDILERLPGWSMRHTGVVPALGRKWIERRVAKMLAGDRRRLAAEDWFDHFFGKATATDPSLLPYYRNRFALPRALAALAILRTIPASTKPFLDLACGLGPFGHYLTQRHNATRVIGLDFNFYLAWGQKHLIAPQGTFICADGNRTLPFKDGALSGALCSDAFVYFHDKGKVLGELERLRARQAARTDPREQPDRLSQGWRGSECLGIRRSCAPGQGKSIQRVRARPPLSLPSESACRGSYRSYGALLGQVAHLRRQWR